jgi:uncharacterized protein YrrD
MDIKTLKGIAVVSIDDGARLGAINDALFDLEDRCVRAFIVGDGGLFGGSTRILDMSDVQSIGADAVMIGSRDLLKADRDDTRYQTFANMGAVTSLRVVSQSGDLVGNLATIHVETSDGKFSDIEVSRHGLLGAFQAKIVVPAESVISFGRDVAVIPDKFVQTADKKDGEATSGDHTDIPETPTPS